MPSYNLAVLDTTPGASSHPFCPPPNWDGGPDAYKELIRSRYKDQHWHQIMLSAVWFHQRKNFLITGPYGNEAKEIMVQVCKKYPAPKPIR